MSMSTLRLDVIGLGMTGEVTAAVVQTVVLHLNYRWISRPASGVGYYSPSVRMQHRVYDALRPSVPTLRERDHYTSEKDCTMSWGIFLHCCSGNNRPAFACYFSGISPSLKAAYSGRIHGICFKSAALSFHLHIL